jgi:hypothetical protein
MTHQVVYHGNEFRASTTGHIPVIDKNTTTWNENNGQPTFSNHEELSTFSYHKVVSDNNNGENCMSLPSKMIGGDFLMVCI